MQSKLRSILKAGGLVYSICIGLVVGILFFSGLSTTMEYVAPKSWHIIALASEANPGAGKGGILEVYFINFSAPGKVPNVNLTTTMEGWAATVGYSGWNNTATYTQKLRQGVKFYIVCRVRGNATMCKRTVWQDTDLRCRFSCAGLGYASLTNMSRYVSGNNSGWSMLYVNFYINNSNAGFSLTKGQTITNVVTELDAYY